MENRTRHFKTQKDSEKYVFNPIAELLGIPFQEIDFTQESPDIHFEYEGFRIGAEVISCHSLSIETNGEICVVETQNELQKILNQYKELLITRGESSKRVSVSFKNNIYQVTKLKDIKNDIFNEIDALLEIHDDDFDDLREYKYVNYANSYDINIDFVDVGIIDSYWSSPAKVENILKCINRKETKIFEYKKKNPQIKEYWLIVDFRQDRDVDIRHISIPNLQTEYKRVYLTKYNDLVQIK